ncbi:ras GTPase-activating protein-binding protein 1 isoform X4 [Heterodontus francisci]|uniref:ras GTPase-activating protein-binding protein 1 isoform X4 n=1 Tax=Heterodontus francisci TaxID=7792 RepID=UPI00355B6024
MVMEKPSPLLVGREFVRQYYTLLNQAPDYLHRFYGKNSSYVHGGLTSNGDPAEAVYGQAEIHKKVMSLQFRDCHTKIKHVDAHATLNDGVVVQVMGELSNNRQPMRRFMQTFVLAPEGSVANKFYVHNDIFRYQDEVFGDSDTEPHEESEEEVEESEERQPSPEAVQDDSGVYYDAAVSNGLEEPLEEHIVASEPEPEPIVEEAKPEPILEEEVAEDPVVKSPSPPPADPAPVVAEDSRPRPETKPEIQIPPPRPRDQRIRERQGVPPRGPRPGRSENEPGDTETRRTIRYPDSHQLFVGNLPHDIDETELKEFFTGYGNVVELRINTKSSGGKLPNFGFVVFDDPEPVQKILSSKPIKFRGELRLNVEEKKTRPIREGERRGDDRRENRPRGPGGPRGGLGGGMMRDREGRGGLSRGGLTPKPGPGAGRGGGQGEPRFSGPRH